MISLVKGTAEVISFDPLEGLDHVWFTMVYYFTLISFYYYSRRDELSMLLTLNVVYLQLWVFYKSVLHILVTPTMEKIARVKRWYLPHCLSENQFTKGLWVEHYSWSIGKKFINIMLSILFTTRLDGFQINFITKKIYQNSFIRKSLCRDP